MDKDSHTRLMTYTAGSYLQIRSRNFKIVPISITIVPNEIYFNVILRVLISEIGKRVYLASNISRATTKFLQKCS